MLCLCVLLFLLLYDVSGAEIKANTTSRQKLKKSKNAFTCQVIQLQKHVHVGI